LAKSPQFAVAEPTLNDSETAQREPYSLRAFLLYFLRLGALGFGGPIALAGYMQRDLVETRGWIEKKDYDEGLALAQLSPGPLAAQLAIYLGWLRGRVLGAALVSLAFISPSFVMVVALSALYVSFGGLPWMQGAFYGVGAAVIAIIGRSANNLLKKTLKRDALLWAIAVVNAATTALTRSEVVWLVVLGGLVTLAVRFRSSSNPLVVVAPFPLAWISGLHGPVAAATLWKVLTYFVTAGIFVFGSGLAIVPFLHGGVVEGHHWLSEQEFLDAVAVAMITPGPVVITVAFIGYLVAGPLGAVLASIGVFAPCFFIVVLAAPHYRRFAGKGRVKAFVEGVTAGAVGAIAGAVIVLARKSLVDPSAIGIALGSLLILLRVKKLPEPLLILGAALLGVAVKELHQ
jgi:chromate transporter